MLPTEQQEAEAFAKHCRAKGYKFTHVPNETGSDPKARARATRMKRAGTSRGFPDYLIFKDGKRYAIELKSRRDGAKATSEQRAWLVVLAQYGFECAVCHGAEEAKQFLED